MAHQMISGKPSPITEQYFTDHARNTSHNMPPCVHQRERDDTGRHDAPSFPPPFRPKHSMEGRDQTHSYELNTLEFNSSFFEATTKRTDGRTKQMAHQMISGKPSPITEQYFTEDHARNTSHNMPPCVHQRER
ncbi:jg23399, partial [Pararge aegeria aegeria]